MIKRMQTLYKKNTQGKIEQWSVKVLARAGSTSVVTTYGEVGGKQIEKSHIITEGKNVGKKNQTDHVEQATLEAQAKWNKKLKSGYVQTMFEAQADKLDKIIEGGIVPMLAHSYDDYKDEVEFPCYIQPKLDGQRCIAVKKNGVVTLWTRTRKPITSCPHIAEQVWHMLLGVEGDVTLDGELYSHKHKDNFEQIMKAVRKKEFTKACDEIEYHVYDIVMNEPFNFRNASIESLPDYFTNVKIVPTSLVKNHKELQLAHDLFVRDGFEGVMVRSVKGLYENKRSKHLLKFKSFKDAEFKIIGFVKGKDDVVCAVLDNGKGTTFKATMSGDKKQNQKYLKNSSDYDGKMLTVKYQGLTGKNGVPRFPVGLRIREEE